MDERSNLLESIRSGIQLKSATERKEVEETANPAEKEEEKSVAAILARRIAIVGSSDDESDNSDWE